MSYPRACKLIAYLDKQHYKRHHFSQMMGDEPQHRLLRYAIGMFSLGQLQAF